MGSLIAGLKAGIIAGLVYIGGLALFNVALLYASEGSVLTYISSNFSQVCSPVATVNATTVQSCFNSLAPVYVPFVAFVGFFVALGFSAVFGRLYEIIPGTGPSFKGLLIAPLTAITLVFFSLVGFTFEPAATDVLTAALIVLTVIFGLLLGYFYHRYTRLVRFESQDDSALRIIVDRSDLTGRETTMAANSTHNVEARVSDDSSFRGWLVSGGITVEDSKSFETSMDIKGDGLLKGLVSKKY